MTGNTNAGARKLKLITGNAVGAVSGSSPVTQTLTLSGISKIRSISVQHGGTSQPVTHVWSRVLESESWTVNGSGTWYPDVANDYYAKIISISGNVVQFQCYTANDQNGLSSATMYYTVVGEV